MSQVKAGVLFHALMAKHLQPDIQSAGGTYHSAMWRVNETLWRPTARRMSFLCAFRRSVCGVLLAELFGIVLSRYLAAFLQSYLALVDG